MEERPILFSGPMVRAILEGRKTQTRRVVKPQFEGETPLADLYLSGKWDKRPRCPYGKPGDRLWVRETWRPWHETDHECGCGEHCDCRRTPPTKVCFKANGLEIQPEDRALGVKWRPSIHMPRSASRITLEVVDVRVGRIESITEEDAKAEGAIYHSMGGWQHYEGSPLYRTARGSFLHLWEKINGDESLLSNPWVWVIEFKQVKP